MSGSGLARSIQRPHQERQIACRRLDEELLVNVLGASYIEPVHSACIKLMREVPFDPFSPLPLQALSAVEAAGGSIVVPIFAFPGGRRFHFRDVDGHELAAMQAD